MSAAIILPYRLLITPPPPPPTPVLGVTSMDPIEIDIELLEEILLFNDTTAPSKPGEIV